MFCLRIARIFRRLYDEERRLDRDHAGSPAVTSEGSGTVRTLKFGSVVQWSMDGRHIGGGHTWPHGIFIPTTVNTKTTTSTNANGHTCTNTGASTTGSIRRVIPLVSKLQSLGFTHSTPHYIPPLLPPKPDPIPIPSPKP